MHTLLELVGSYVKTINGAVNIFLINTAMLPSLTVKKFEKSMKKHALASRNPF